MTNQELLALIKKNPISVGCGVLCLALGAGIYFRSDQIPVKEAELAQKSAEGERHALNITNAAKLKDQYDAIVVANKEIDSRLIHASQLAANAEYFFKLESDTGVKLTTDPKQTGQAPPKGKALFTTVAFTVTAQGDLSQLLNFLHQLESGRHYSRVLSASVSTNNIRRDGPVTLSLNLELLGLP